MQFHSGYVDSEYRAASAASNAKTGPLSLYYHIPFCDTLCFNCGCNKVVTKNRARAAPYLARLHKEIALQSTLFVCGRRVVLLFWGGGTPTFISHDQMRVFLRVTRVLFVFFVVVSDVN